MKLNVKRIIAPVLSATLVLSSIPFNATTAYAAMGDIDYVNETMDKGDAVSYSTNDRTYTKITTTNINLAKIISTKDVSLYLKDATGEVKDYDINGRPAAPVVKYDGINDTLRIDGDVIDGDYEVKVGTGAWTTGTNAADDYQLADFKAGASIQVRAKAVSGSKLFKSAVRTYTMPRRPAAPGASLDFKTGILKGSTKMRYVILDAQNFVTPDPAKYHELDGTAFTGTTEDLSEILTATTSSNKKIVVWTEKTATAPASMPKIITVTQRTTATPVVSTNFGYVPLKDMLTTTASNHEYSVNGGKTYVSLPRTGVSAKSLVPTSGTRTVLVREKATASKLASIPFEITVNARAAHGMSLGFDTRSESAISLNGDTGANQYSLDGGVTWKAWTGPVATTVFAEKANRGKTLRLRIAGSGYLTGTLTPASTEASIVIPKTQAKAPAARIDYKKETIVGVTSAMEYRIGEGTWTPVTGTSIPAEPNANGGQNKIYTVRYKNTPGAVASAEAKITIKPRPAAPTVSFTQSIVYDEDNNKVFAKMSGITTLMEFKKSTDTAWTKYSEAAFKAKYSSSASVAKAQSFDMDVRLAATATAYASASVDSAAPTATKAQSLQEAFTAASTAVYSLTLASSTAPAVLTAAKNAITNPGITATWAESFSGTGSTGTILINYAAIRKSKLITLFGSGAVETLDVKVEAGATEGKVKVTSVGATHYTLSADEVNSVTSTTAPLTDIQSTTAATITSGDSYAAKIGQWLTVYKVANSKLVAFKSIKLTAKDVAAAVAPAYAIDYVGEQTTAAIAATDEYTTVSASYEGEWTIGSGAKLALIPGKPVYFRKAATGANPPSAVQKLDVPARPAELKGVNISYALEKVNGYVTGNMEYNVDGTTTFVTADLASSAVFSPLIPAEGGTPKVLVVRSKASVGASFAGTPLILGTLSPKSTAPNFTIDYVTEKTTAVVPATVEYNTTQEDYTGVWTTGSGEALALNPPLSGGSTNVFIRTKASGNSFASAAQTIVVAQRPGAPAAAPTVDYVTESLSANYLPATQEYSVDNGVNYISGDLTKKDSLNSLIPSTGSAKTILVRNKAVTTGTKSFASATKSFVLAKRDVAPAFASVFTITATGATAIGNTKLTGLAATYEYALTTSQVTSINNIASYESGNTLVPWTATSAGAATDANAKIVLPGYKIWFRTKATGAVTPTGDVSVYTIKGTDVKVGVIVDTTIVKKPGTNDATATATVGGLTDLKFAAVSPGTTAMATFITKVSYGMTSAEAEAALGLAAGGFTNGTNMYTSVNNDKYVVAIELKDGRVVAAGYSTNAIGLVSVTSISEGQAGDSSITGLLSGEKYIISDGSKWYDVVGATHILGTGVALTDAGMLAAVTAANAGLTGTSITGLTAGKTYTVVRITTVDDGTTFTVGNPTGSNIVHVDSTGQLLLIGKSSGKYQAAKLATVIAPLGRLSTGDTFSLAGGNKLASISISGTNSVNLGAVTLTQATTINHGSAGTITAGAFTGNFPLTITGAGTGSVTLGNLAGALTISNTGNGNITTGTIAENVTIDSVETQAGGLIKLGTATKDISISGTGTRQVMVGNAANINIDGARNVILTGTTGTATTVAATYTGKLKTDLANVDLKALTIGAATEIEHNATGTLKTGDVTGAFNLKVSGTGSGVVTIGDVAGSVELTNTGSGAVGIGANEGNVTVSGTGTGLVTVASITTGNLAVTGNRPVTVSGTAGGTVSATGSGVLTLSDDVTGLITIGGSTNTTLTAAASAGVKIESNYSGIAKLADQAGTAATPGHLTVGTLKDDGKVEFTGSGRTSFIMIGSGSDATAPIKGSPTPDTAVKIDSGLDTVTINPASNTVAGAMFSKVFGANKVTVTLDTSPADIKTVTIVAK